MFVQAARGKATGPKKEKWGAGVQWAPKMGKSPRVNFLDFAAYVAKTIFFLFCRRRGKTKKCSERWRNFGCGPDDAVEKRCRTYW